MIVISDKEKLENYKDKLDVMIEKHEAKAEAISRFLITNKLLNDKKCDYNFKGKIGWSLTISPTCAKAWRHPEPLLDPYC